MHLERLLQINVATMAALGTLLLCMGPQDTVMSLVVLVAVIASILLTDVTGWFRLNRMAANIAALAAVGWSLLELRLTLGSGYEVLGLARLLIYLQIVMFFQQKDEKAYWQLMMLSLLQVVVAAAYSQGVWFGMLLVVYMMVGLSGLAMLFFFRRWNCFRSIDKPRPEQTSGGGRWPLAGQKPAFVSTTAGNAIGVINPEWFRRMTMMGLGTFLLALMIFFMVPRLGGSAWRGATLARRHMVGFNDNVTLGELGQILENRQQVMQVKLEKWSTGHVFPKMDDIYLRGAVLTRYKNNAWYPKRPRPDKINVLASYGPMYNKPQFSNHAVLQTIKIEPSDRQELFTVWPFFPYPEPNENLWYDKNRKRLMRPPEQCAVRYEYRLGTYALGDHSQPPLIPSQYFDDIFPPPGQPNPLLQMPDLPHVKATADRWVEESGLDGEDRYAVALMLQEKFHDPTLFQYSLEGQPRDLEMDNIEDFLVNNPRGHCEYFATALAMMLRSQGIPSRLVVGYRCDEYNDLGEYYRVRQLHAHAWVEAYLTPEQLPEDVYRREALATMAREAHQGVKPEWLNRPRLPDRWRIGGWLRLEPTPAGDELSEADSSVFQRIDRGFEWLQSFWSDYVMEMDRGRQRKAIYEPAVRAVQDAAQHVRDPQWWRELPKRISDAVNLSAWFTLGGWWRWVVLVMLVGVGIAVAVYVGRRVVRLFRWALGRLPARVAARVKRRRSEVVFYRRLESILARHELVRAPGQTQREFATAAGEKLAETSNRRELAALPAEVADAFYHVRFGRLPLDAPQASNVEKALAVLEEVAAT